MGECRNRYDGCLHGSQDHVSGMQRLLSLNEKAAEYRALQSNVESAAARGYVDTVIAPADTRKYVIGAFEMLFTKREDRPV